MASSANRLPDSFWASRFAGEIVGGLNRFNAWVFPLKGGIIEEDEGFIHDLAFLGQGGDPFEADVDFVGFRIDREIFDLDHPVEEVAFDDLGAQKVRKQDEVVFDAGVSGVSKAGDLMSELDGREHAFDRMVREELMVGSGIQDPFRLNPIIEVWDQELASFFSVPDFLMREDVSPLRDDHSLADREVFEVFKDDFAGEMVLGVF